jgi:hypothetical protein
MHRLKSWRRPFTRHRIERRNKIHGNGDSRAIAFYILELSLPATTVMTEIRIQAAVRQSVGAGHPGIHAVMHVMVTLHLGRWAVRAFMVIFDLICHRAGLQREVQPDSRKQPEGAAAPGSMLFSDTGQVTQLLVLARISTSLPNSSYRGY